MEDPLFRAHSYGWSGILLLLCAITSPWGLQCPHTRAPMFSGANAERERAVPLPGLQMHMPSDPLPPTRPLLLQFPIGPFNSEPI